MTIWLDAQLSPVLASWIKERFGVTTHPVRDLGLRDATDHEIYIAAKKADAIVITKDNDFLHLLEQKGPPPRIIWLTCGNTSNTNLKKILIETLNQALELLNQGESLVEISGSR